MGWDRARLCGGTVCVCVCLSALTVGVFADRIQALAGFLGLASLNRGLFGRVKPPCCLSVLNHCKHPSPVASLAPNWHKGILTLKDKLFYAPSSSDRPVFGPPQAFSWALRCQSRGYTRWGRSQSERVGGTRPSLRFGVIKNIKANRVVADAFVLWFALSEKAERCQN